MIVIDSSALVEALVGQSPPEALMSAVADERLHVPYLLDYEVRSALRGLLLGRKITRVRAEGARLVAGSLGMTRYPDSVTCGRAWELGRSLSACDATYVALAEILGCRLVTTDRRIGAAVRTAEVVCF